MDHTFDDDYWDRIWTGDRAAAMSTSTPNPHLQAQTAGLTPGSALDAGCGAGAEAIWLATEGWQVTAADIARAALAFGRERAASAGVTGKVDWVQADLSTWQPDTAYDLVTTHYAHSTIPQLELYERIATWVAPGGTLLIVGHLHPDHHDRSHHDRSHPDRSHHDRSHQGDGDQHGRAGDGRPPAAASATAADITAVLDPASWDVVAAEESQRTVIGPGGRQSAIHDAVVRADRRT